jgi:hypothetical protein
MTSVAIRLTVSARKPWLDTVRVHTISRESPRCVVSGWGTPAEKARLVSCAKTSQAVVTPTSGARSNGIGQESCLRWQFHLQ